MDKMNTVLYLMGSLQDAWTAVLQLPSMRRSLCETMHLEIGDNFDIEGPNKESSLTADLVITRHHFGYGSEEPRVNELRISLYVPWDVCTGEAETGNPQAANIYLWVKGLFDKDYNQSSITCAEEFSKNGIRKKFEIALCNHSVSVDEVLKLTSKILTTAAGTGKLSWRAIFLPETFEEYFDQCLGFHYRLEVDGPMVSMRVSSEDPLPIIIAIHEKFGFTDPLDPDTGKAYPSTLLLPLD